VTTRAPGRWSGRPIAVLEEFRLARERERTVADAIRRLVHTFVTALGVRISGAGQRAHIQAVEKFATLR
jgi:hypothetical protein